MSLSLSILNAFYLAGSPTRAITATLSSAATSNTALSLNDGNAGGTFFPASPTIATGSTSIQFVYVPPPGATGTITLTATGAGGQSSVAIRPGTPTTLFSDAFAGTDGTNLSAHTSDSGGTWAAKGNSSAGGSLLLTGANAVRYGGTDVEYDSNAAVPANADFDSVATFKIFNAATNGGMNLFARSSSGGSAYQGYRFGYYDGTSIGWFLVLYAPGGAASFLSTSGSVLSPAPATGSTLRLAVRAINGNQWLFPLYAGTLILPPVQDNTYTSGNAGIMGAANTGTPGDSAGQQFSSFAVTTPPAPFPATIPVSTPNWLHTPFNTYGNGTGPLSPNFLPGNSTVAAILCEGGSPASVTVGQTGNLLLGVDVSRAVSAGLAAANYPVLSYSLNGGAWTDVQLTPASTNVAILSGGTVGTYTLQYLYKSGFVPITDTGVSKWNPLGNPALPPFAIVVTGLTVDTGAQILPPALPTGGIDLAQGDSITEGLRAASATDSATSGDATAHFMAVIGSVYGSLYGQLGYGATGYEQAGQGNAPAFPTLSGSYFSGVSRLDANGYYQPLPNRIWIFHGTNGTVTQSDVATAIATARARAPLARINLCVPPGGFARAAIAAAVAACGDSNVKLLDAGTAFQVGLTGIVAGGSARANDGLHPTRTTSMEYGGILVAQAAQAAGGGPFGGFFF